MMKTWNPGGAKGYPCSVSFQSGEMLRACFCCGLVQEVPPVDRESRAICVRCGTTLSVGERSRGDNGRTVAAALAALILYPLAISLPIMRLERFGHSTEASIWTGSIGLLETGEVFVGSVVLLCSIVIPLAKLLGLFTLCVRGPGLSRRQKARTYRVIEWAGRWGMLDVLLIALLVAWIKIGDLVDVSPGPGALTFTLCVLLSLLASAHFDPHALWDHPEEEGKPIDESVESSRT